jgi:hypothetical protein
VPAHDDFNRANGALGAAPSGHVWTNRIGSHVVFANKAAMTSGSIGLSTITVTADARVKADVGPGIVDLGFVLHYKDAQNYFYVVLVILGSPNNRVVIIGKRDNNVSTNLVTSPEGVFAGSSSVVKLTVETEGPAIRAYVDGVHRVTYVMTAGEEAEFSPSAVHGLCTFLGAHSGFDNFSVNTPTLPTATSVVANGTKATGAAAGIVHAVTTVAAATKTALGAVASTAASSIAVAGGKHATGNAVVDAITAVIGVGTKAASGIASVVAALTASAERFLVGRLFEPVDAHRATDAGGSAVGGSSDGAGAHTEGSSDATSYEAG